MRYETPLLHKDGHEFLVEISLTALRRGGGWIINSFVKDITQKPAVLILALGGLKVRHIDSERGYFRAELTVIPSVCGDSGEIDPEVARHLRLSFGQAEGKECALPDGRLWHGGVFGVLHAKPILPGASAPTGGGSRVWPLEL
jgi:hypothetical protein